MTDETRVEIVDGTVEPDGPAPELKPAVDDILPGPAELAVRDPSDEHELMVRMDDHDVRMLLMEVQGAALRKWVYDLGVKGQGLTVHAVQDITQRMNWTGKAKIGVLPETLTVERLMADEGNGEEPFWVATIAARDEITGQTQIGSAMEPQYMKLKEKTANAKRRDGQPIPEDNKVFDRFSRTKAIQKAQRNAMAAFIPEEIEQTVIGMFTKDASRVERIQTEAEVKVAEMPPPAQGEEADALRARARELYDEIRELGGGQGKVKVTPGHFHAYMTNAEHSVDRLRDFIGYLEQRSQEIPVELEREAREREAVESAVKVACPKCEAAPGKFCSGIRGSHGERIRARLEQLEAGA